MKKLLMLILIAMVTITFSCDNRPNKQTVVNFDRQYFSEDEDPDEDGAAAELIDEIGDIFEAAAGAKHAKKITEQKKKLKAQAKEIKRLKKKKKKVENKFASLAGKHKMSKPKKPKKPQKKK